MALPRRCSLINITVFSLASVLALGCAPPAGATPGREHEAQDSIEFYTTEVVNDAALARRDDTVGMLEHTLLTDLREARFAIDAALYSLNRESIVEALLDASARGLEVRVAAECENRYGGYREAFERLEAGGIHVVDDNSSYGGEDPNCPDAEGGSMHHKFFVIDGRTVWMGSTNMTWTGFNYNKNHALRVTAATIADVYQSEFEALHAGLFSRRKPGRGIEFHTVEGVEVATAFSPHHSGTQSDTRQLVLDAVAAAENSIRFALFYFTDTEVQAALAANAGITQGAMDAVGASYAGSAHDALCALGVPVKIENFPGKLHHKLGIFDAEGGDPRVIAGSANWTASGFAYNDESVMLIHDAAIAVRALKEYQAGSARCGELACVCSDSSDNDFDGHADVSDGDCGAQFVCRP
jgi:phosphatidylserine/phosphatidylglycerophosphate/cardiolipin synthase-like enzyme